MAQRAFLRMALLSAILITHYRIQAQTPLRSGYYEINAGSFTECCGFGGNDFFYELPAENQQFVELIIDSSGTTARLTFLQPDMFTVFRSPQAIGVPGFPFSFYNGMVFSNYIRFLSPAPLPMWGSWSYTVTNLAGGLGISGAAVSSPYGLDLPNQFQHTNVVASLVPNPTAIDHVVHNGTNIQFHFSGRPFYDYTLEFADSLTAPDWQPLAAYRAKLQTIDVTVTHSLTNTQTRFFRIRQQPCDCRRTAAAVP